MGYAALATPSFSAEVDTVCGFASFDPLRVMRGLGPRIHPFLKTMDCTGARARRVPQYREPQVG
jgi:hypothetical protein